MPRFILEISKSVGLAISVYSIDKHFFITIQIICFIFQIRLNGKGRQFIFYKK